MNDILVYSIPVALWETYRGRRVIVRTHDPALLVDRLAGEDLEKLSYIQILDLRSDFRPLMLWKESIPLDVVVKDPGIDLSLLYEWSPLPAKSPVRVTIPVTPGFGKAVKLATSLSFSVKLEVMQPDASLVDELFEVTRMYLHQTTVSEPIEFLHSTFLSFFREKSETLWVIQEEHPDLVRYVTVEGNEALSRRLKGLRGEVSGIFGDLNHLLVDEGGECFWCEFLENCSGYFKWPRREYPCDGMKVIFRILREAAEELRRDIVSFSTRPGGE